MSDTNFALPPGVIVLTTHGSVTMETCEAWGTARAELPKAGVTNAIWQIQHASLVDKARNEAAAQFMAQTAQYKRENPTLEPYLFFVDADMHWAPEAMMTVLKTAYQDLPWADIVGGWCPLRGEPHLPTIDPGSGRWESVPPNTGPVEVMRTGSAFILIKRRVFERVRAPWYQVRVSGRPLDYLQEIDTYALTKFDGVNPLRQYPEWQTLERIAADEAGPPDQWYPYSHVGEDSNLCDRARAAGCRIVVQTNAVVSHVDRKLIGYQDHLDAMKRLKQAENWAAGVLETVTA